MRRWPSSCRVSSTSGSAGELVADVVFRTILRDTALNVSVVLFVSNSISENRWFGSLHQNDSDITFMAIEYFVVSTNFVRCFSNPKQMFSRKTFKRQVFAYKQQLNLEYSPSSCASSSTTTRVCRLRFFIRSWLDIPCPLQKVAQVLQKEDRASMYSIQVRHRIYYTSVVDAMHSLPSKTGVDILTTFVNRLEMLLRLTRYLMDLSRMAS